MDTPDEIARDEWNSDLVDRISQEAIEGFTADRLRSYYVAHPTLAADAFRMYQEATETLPVSSTAALVLVTTAIEVGLKTTLLKPVVFGLVHNESVADLVSDLVVKHNGFDRFRALIAGVLSNYGGIDLNTCRMADGMKTVWEQIDYLVKKRNAVVHQAKLASEEDTTLAMQVAGYVLGVFLTEVLKTFGLELNMQFAIIPIGTETSAINSQME